MLPLLCTAASQAADVVRIESDKALLGYAPAVMNLIPHTQQWNAGQQKLTLAQVQQAKQSAQFTHVRDQAPSGPSRAADGHWYRVKIENPSTSPTRDWVLELAQPILQTFELYLTHPDGRIERIEAGDLHPRAAQQLSERAFAFPLPLMPGEQLQIHLHVATQSPHRVPLRLWPRDAFVAHSQKENLLIGVFCGLAMTIIVYNLFAFSSQIHRLRQMPLAR